MNILIRELIMKSLLIAFSSIVITSVTLIPSIAFAMNLLGYKTEAEALLLNLISLLPF